MRDKKHFTLDNDTTASTPGNITFMLHVWLIHRPIGPLIFIFSFLLFNLIAGFAKPVVLASILIFISIGVWYWISLKEHYQADSNAGIVISVSPPLVAVATDLSKYGDEGYPVLKIIKYSPRRAITIGEKIGTVAVYEDRDEDSDHWSNFFPLPIEYATNRQCEIIREVSRYPKEQWELIASALPLIPKPYKPGLYRINDELSRW